MVSGRRKKQTKSRHQTLIDLRFSLQISVRIQMPVHLSIRASRFNNQIIPNQSESTSLLSNKQIFFLIPNLNNLKTINNVTFVQLTLIMINFPMMKILQLKMKNQSPTHKRTPIKMTKRKMRILVSSKTKIFKIYF